MPNKILQIFLCIVAGGGIIWALLQWQYRQQYQPGGFSRRPSEMAPVLLRQYNLGEHEYYLAGAADAHVYLGNKAVQNRLLQMDFAFRQVREIPILLQQDSIVWMGVKLTVDSPAIFLSEVITRSIFHGSLSPLSLHRVTGPRFSFTRCAPLSASSWILTVYDSLRRQDVLAKWSTGQIAPTSAPGILQKQVDGRFCEDGMLLCSPSKKFLAYIYYYRNQFIFLDSNLTLIHRYQTIDTNSLVKISLDTSVSDQSVTISAASQTIQDQAYLTDDYLFVNSAVRADNDPLSAFISSRTIDVYAVADGAYQYSFYLPLVNGSPMTSFLVKDDLLLAAYRKHYLAAFRLPPMPVTYESPGLSSIATTRQGRVHFFAAPVVPVPDR